jgi:hypothetical protein
VSDDRLKRHDRQSGHGMSVGDDGFLGKAFELASSHELLKAH